MVTIRKEDGIQQNDAKNGNKDTTSHFTGLASP